MSIFIPYYWSGFLVLVLVLVSPGLGRFNVLERKTLELVRREQNCLHKADTHSKLVIDDPDLINVYDCRNPLALLESTEIDQLLLRIVSLWYKSTITVSQNLDTKSRCVLARIFALTNIALEEISRLDNIWSIHFPENLQRVLGDVIEHRLLKLADTLQDLGVIQREIDAVRSLSGLRVSVRTQPEWCAENGELKPSLSTDSVDVDGLTGIASVLLELREYN